MHHAFLNSPLESSNSWVSLALPFPCSCSQEQYNVTAFFVSLSKGSPWESELVMGDDATMQHNTKHWPASHSSMEV